VVYQDSQYERYMQQTCTWIFSFLCMQLRFV